MLFSSMIFLWVFLPLVLIFHRLLDRRFHNTFLLLASFVFYGWGEPRYLLLMLLSILLNYLGGLGVATGSETGRKARLFLCVAANLALLGYFKYANFFVDTVNGIVPETIRGFSRVALPIGISFYTFQAMSYVIDVYRREVEVQKSFWKLALYVSFFPQLVAGPIIKYHDVDQQLSERTVSPQKTAYGIRRFVFGLGKKVLLANTLAVVPDDVFRLPPEQLGSAVAWLGVVCYSLQIYFDFSGYSDMAIGLGKIFGFDFPENFRYPYLSCSIREFWRRWHISLSTWFKEYLYIPLGGNRCSATRVALNLLIVFAATGIWHGAAWTFLLWGLWHGLFLLLERYVLKEKLEHGPWRILGHCYTQLALLLGWMLFRSDSLEYAWRYGKVMFSFAPGVYRFENYFNVLLAAAMIAGVALCGIVQQSLPGLERALFREDRTARWECAALPLLLVLCLLALSGSGYNPFIYFRF